MPAKPSGKKPGRVKKPRQKDPYDLRVWLRHLIFEEFERLLRIGFEHITDWQRGLFVVTLYAASARMSPKQRGLWYRRFVRLGELEAQGHPKTELFHFVSECYPARSTERLWANYLWFQVHLEPAWRHGEAARRAALFKMNADAEFDLGGYEVGEVVKSGTLREAAILWLSYFTYGNDDDKPVARIKRALSPDRRP